MLSAELLPLVLRELGNTLYMTVLSTLLAYVLGVPLGILLTVTDREGVAPNAKVNLVLGTVVNALRSVPFIILMVALIGFTRFLLGTSIGSTAAIVPLVIASAPFVARVVEGSLKEVDKGVIEAAQSMGATKWQIISKILLPEAKPGLIVGAALSITAILGYSTMAGIVGGGGLGAVANNFGYYRSQTDVMWVMILILVLLVQLFQGLGNSLARRFDKRIR